jgi:hypothetical protein
MEIIEKIFGYVYALGIGIIGFFLKRSYNQIDRLEACKADKEDLISVQADVQKLYRDIGEIKTSYLTKEDFFREQAKTDRKLDRIMEILLDIKGGNKSNG